MILCLHHGESVASFSASRTRPTEDQRLELDAPISAVELASSVKSMAPLKAPGPDGLTAAIYQLDPTLFGEGSVKGAVPQIGLLQVYPTQTGFVAGRRIHDHIIFFRDLQHKCAVDDDEGFAMLLDFEKAWRSPRPHRPHTNLCRALIRRSAPGLADSAGEADFLADPRFEFDGLWDVVHLDEILFNADIGRGKYYHVPAEKPLQRSWKSKRIIPKVMFLDAVAKPTYDAEHGGLFDGKFGMWSAVKYLPAARLSRNRPAGTIVTTLANVDATLYREYGITRVIPAIEENFPSTHKHAILQQPHGAITDEVLAHV
ncbi:hypothetical protein DYB32_009794 [Aphanomyces invadans]|uniref:Uncharacterized protein n=1 Tax=Aphanomyces invadans TaxID=157072 RepID=A0A3R6YS22_9STRA|nr:hypothetical protein DYB32_009794 [Aphanomyces invadans]